MEKISSGQTFECYFDELLSPACSSSIDKTGFHFKLFVVSYFSSDTLVPLTPPSAMGQYLLLYTLLLYYVHILLDNSPPVAALL